MLTKNRQSNLTASGEIISSSITQLKAEIWQDAKQNNLSELNFGSFIRAESQEYKIDVVAVICDVVVGPKDTSHKPSALKLTRDQLKVEQPHIFALLSTEIHATVIGYFQDGKYHKHLPPKPAQVHDFIYGLSEEEIKMATAGSDFLRPIAYAQTASTDELIAACVRQAYLAYGSDYQFLVEVGQTLSRMFHEDYDRLLAILSKIRPD